MAAGLESLSLPASAGVFAASAVCVWWAGWRVARYADALEKRTGMGNAWTGMLLLGGISGLPEMAVAATAASSGHPVLSVNNLVGSAAVNLAILGAADAAVKREALSVTIATPVPMLQAALMIVMLGVIAAGTLAGHDAGPLGIGAWSWAVLGLYLFFLAVIRHTRAAEGWQARRMPAGTARDGDAAPPMALSRLVPRILAAAAVILAAGYALAQSGDVIARKTGLGESFFGAVGLSFATSLSDISIVLSAVRLGRYEMAIADLFGSALFTLALVFLVDAVHAGPAVLAAVGPATTFMAVLAMVMTALFIAGAVERRGLRVGRMGVDTLALLGVYAAGVAVMYRMR